MVQGILQPLGSNLFDDIGSIDSSIDSFVGPPRCHNHMKAGMLLRDTGRQVSGKEEGGTTWQEGSRRRG